MNSKLGAGLRLVLAALAVGSGLGAQKTWDGSTSTAWSESSNWTPDGAPSSSDDVTIPDAATTPNDPSSTGSQTCRDLTIESGGTLAVTSGTLSISGDFDQSGTLTGAGTVIFNGTTQTITAGSGIVAFQSLTIASGASVSTSATSIVVPGNLNVFGSLTTMGASISAGPLSVATTGNLQGPNMTSLVVGGLFVGGTLSAPQAVLTSSAGVGVPGSGNLGLGTGTHTITGGGSSVFGVLTVSGLLRLTNAATSLIVAGPNTLPDVEINLSVGNGVLASCIVGGTLTLESGSLTLSSAILLGDAVFNGGTLITINAPTSINGNVTFAGTSVTGNFSASVKGDWTSNATFDPPSGTVQFTGTTLQQVMMGGGSFRTLTIGTGAQVTFADGCHVRNDLTSNSGTSVLSFAGAGSRVEGVFTSLGSVIVDGTLELNSGATFSGPLAGTGLIDCDAAVTLQGPSTLTPSFRLAGDVTIYSSLFTPTTGCAIFDGDGSVVQIVRELSAAAELVFACLEIEPQARVEFQDEPLHVTGDTLWNGYGNVLEYADFDGDFEGTPGPGDDAVLITGTGGVEWSGGRIAYPGICIPGGTININTPGSVVVNVPNGFDVQVDVGIGLLLTIENDTLVIGGDLNILSGTVVSDGDLVLTADSIVIESAGTLDALGNRLELTNGVPVTVRGRLEVGAGGNLVLAASAIDVQSGGVLSLVGTPSNRARITGNNVGGWTAAIGPSATLEANAFLVQEMGVAGIDVDIAANLGAFPLDVRDGIFDRVAPNGVLLEIDRPLGVRIQLDDLQFKNSAGATNARNVRVHTFSEPVTFEGWGGAFGGPRFEDDGGPLDNFALWGSQIAYLVVREHTAQHDVFWRTTFEDAPVTYKIERAPGPGGPFVQIGSDVIGVGPSLYVVSDTTITPATPYRYRLREVLFAGPPEITKVIKTVLVDGVSNPATIPGSGSGPNGPQSLVGPHGSGGSKSGKLKKAGLEKPTPGEDRETDAGLQDMLDAALANEGERWIEIELPAGRHGSFTFAPSGHQSLRITASPGEHAVIDVSEAPIRIRGLGPRQSVELSGFALASEDSRRPAIVIEECEGIVLLDRLEVRGHGSSGVRLADASAVVLQNVRLPELAPLELERSTAWCRRGRIEALHLSEGSSLESWGLDAFSDVDATSRWHAHRATPAELTLEEVEGELFLTVEGAPGMPWLGFVSLRMKSDLVPDGLPLLLLEDPRTLSNPRALGPDGRDQLALLLPPTLALIDRPLYFQAVLSPDDAPATTPVRSLQL